MSGGHFRLPYFYLEIDVDVEELQKMSKELAERGFPDAAKETIRFEMEILAFRARADVYIERLRDVWKAVDYNVCGDYGDDQVANVVERYRKGIK